MSSISIADAKNFLGSISIADVKDFLKSISTDDAKRILSSIPPVYYSLIIVPLLLLTRPGQFYAKAIACVFAVGFCGFCGIIYGLILVPFGKRTLVNWLTARQFYYSCSFITGIKVELEGLENLEKGLPGVIIQNHQSSMDLIPLGYVFPKNCGVLAKAELKWYPFLGQFMMLSQSIFINRSNHSDAIKAMGQAAEVMKKQNVSIWLFPEGTRARFETADLLPFKKGAFHLAVQAQLPIVPVVVSNYMNIYNSKKNIFSPGKIRVRILPPIETKGKTSSHEDIEGLLTTAREAMLQALREISPAAEAHQNGVVKKTKATN